MMRHFGKILVVSWVLWGLLAVVLCGQEVCRTSSTTWQNVPFAAQRDSFLVEYDDTPNAAGLDAHTSLAARSATAYSQLAVITRFNSANKIDAYNGGGYSAATSLTYAAGVRYHFRVVVRVATHRFTAYVRPAGGAEVLLGQDYRFRTTQDTVVALGYWTLYSSPSSLGTHTVCNWTLTAFAPPPPPPPPPPPAGSASVNLVPFRTTVIATQQQQLYMVVVRADGTIDSFPDLQWASSDTTVAVVDAGGLVTTTPKLGSVTITATNATGVSGRAQITTKAQNFLSVLRVRWRNIPTPKVYQVPTIMPGFPELSLATGLYQFDLLTGGDTVVGHALCPVSP